MYARPKIGPCDKSYVPFTGTRQLHHHPDTRTVTQFSSEKVHNALKIERTYANAPYDRSGQSPASG